METLAIVQPKIPTHGPKTLIRTQTPSLIHGNPNLLAQIGKGTLKILSLSGGQII